MASRKRYVLSMMSAIFVSVLFCMTVYISHSRPPITLMHDEHGRGEHLVDVEDANSRSRSRPKEPWPAAALSARNEALDEQWLIDELIRNVASQDYLTWNDQLNIEDVFVTKAFNKMFMEQAFANKSIYFDGDSLLFYTVAAILAVEAGVGYTNYSSFEPQQWHSLYLFDTDRKYPQELQRCCPPTLTWRLDSGYQCGLRNQTTLYFNYYSPGYRNISLNAHTHYNVIYTDLGLFHAMALFPARSSEKPRLLLHLEEYVDDIINYALSTDTKCLIFRAINPIAQTRYVAEYQQWSESYEYAIKQLYDGNGVRRSGVTLNETWNTRVDQCLRENFHNVTDREGVVYEHKGTNVSVIGYDLCVKYAFNYLGSKNLNERYKVYVKWRRQQLELANIQSPRRSRLKLLFLDTFALFDGRANNSMISDGRHYTQIKPAELYVLTNIVYQWC